MNRQKSILLAVAVLLIVVTAGLLVRLKTHQTLGRPGIKAVPVPGSVLMSFDLPEKVGDFSSERVRQDTTVTNMLPKDTSFAQRLYKAEDGFRVNANIVLMGLDRTSIHKPEYCLPGQGWRIDDRKVVSIPVGGTAPYSLPVAQWALTTLATGADGQKTEVRGLYFFWFVADGEETTSHRQRIWWLTRDLVQKGVLQRWAYVSYFTVCEPGREDLAEDRVKKLIAASVPEFQIPLQSGTTVVARQ